MSATVPVRFRRPPTPPAAPRRRRVLLAAGSASALLLALPASGRPSHERPRRERTLVAVVAHADDEGAAAPVLARYAREGVRTYMIVATDGAQGGKYTAVPRGPELAALRTEEARCATAALGAQPPILLGFPDGKLGDYVADPSVLYRLTAGIAAELERLQPDVVLTWGPDGGTGHPDHRLVSDVVTQLARAGAPGVPEQLYYMSLPEEGMRAMSPARGAPPLLVPAARHFTVRVPFTPGDLAASERSMRCHRTQFSDEVVRRVVSASAGAWQGTIPLAPAFPAASGAELFR